MCRKWFQRIIFSIVIVVIAGVNPASAFSRRPPEADFVPGKVLVKFHDGVTSERSAQIVELEGGTLKKVLKSTGIHLIILPEGMDVTDAIKRFSSYPEVLYIEPVQRATPLEEK